MAIKIISVVLSTGEEKYLYEKTFELSEKIKTRSAARIDYSAIKAQHATLSR